MEKQPDTVSVKTEYPPSDIYSSEPPPAYVKGRSNAVQMARIAAYTLVACCFILGFFLLASSYVTASFSASLHKELYQEERPIYERLIEPLEAESRHKAEHHETVEAPEARELPESRDSIAESPQEEAKDDQQEEPKEPKETKEPKEEEKDNAHHIAIKLPIHLDMDDIAAMAGQVNCAVEKRLVTPPGMDGMAVAVICSSGPREWNEDRDEPELVRQLVQQQLEESPLGQHPMAGAPQRLVLRQLLIPQPFMHHSPINQMNSNSIEDSSEEGIVRLIADNVLRMIPDGRDSPRAQGRAIHGPGLVHNFMHPQARAVQQMYAGRPPVEVQRMLQLLQAREESRPEIMQVRVPVESMMQVRAPEFQRPPVEAFRPPVHEQMRMFQARMMKPMMPMRPPMTEGIVQVRPEGLVQVSPNGMVQVRPVTENRPEGMVQINQNGIVQIRPPMETMRPPMESMRPPVESMRPPMEMRTHMEMRSPMEQLVEMRPPVQQQPQAQPRMDEVEQPSSPVEPPTQQPEYLRPHLVQPRSVRSVDHPRDKRERRFA